MYGIRSKYFGDWLQQDFCWGPAESRLAFPSAEAAQAFADRECILHYEVALL